MAMKTDTLHIRKTDTLSIRLHLEDGLELHTFIWGYSTLKHFREC